MRPLPRARAAAGTALAALLLLAGCGCEARTSKISLIGWQGDASSKSSGDTTRGETKPSPAAGLASDVGASVAAGAGPDRWIEHLSWEPRASLFHHFLSPDECDYLIQRATPLMVRSEVVDNDSGGTVAGADIRTSSGAFLPRKMDEVISGIESRIAAWAMVPAENGEGLQVLRYQAGQKYESHYDYFHDGENVKNGGQRVATVLMYLSDVDSGGETVFPSALASADPPPGLSECAQAGLAVRPKKGDALLFFSLTTAGALDPKSLHAGCPVLAGEKWSATKWMRVGEFKA